MNSIAIADQLDIAINSILAASNANPAENSVEIRELGAAAVELRIVPNEEFRVRLKAELLAKAKMRAVMPTALSATPKQAKGARRETISFALLGNTRDYPVQPRSFAASFLAQTAAVFLAVAVVVWAGGHGPGLPPAEVSHLISPVSYVLPVASTQASGGGGGGTHDRLASSKGALPRASEEQIIPPMIVVPNQDAKLIAEPTVVAPPEIPFPRSEQLGDPFSVATLASNGTGSDGGIGKGSHGGVGPGDGEGVGPGTDGGYGGGPYTTGGGVSAPRPIYAPDPEYSDEARKAKFQGSVVLAVVIGADGRPRDIRVSRSVGMGLDEQAESAVRNWRFEPAMKDGRPVAVIVEVEVVFRLY